MKHVLALTFLMMAAVMFTSCAGEGGGPGGGGPGGEHKRPPLEKVIKIALDHATDLTLTADQVTKLQDLAKNPPPPPPHDGKKPDGGKKDGPPPAGGKDAGGPPAGGPGGKHDGGPLHDILNADQLAKLKELVKAEHPGGPDGGGPKGGGKKPQQ